MKTPVAPLSDISDFGLEICDSPISKFPLVPSSPGGEFSAAKDCAYSESRVLRRSPDLGVQKNALRSVGSEDCMIGLILKMRWMVIIIAFFSAMHAVAFIAMGIVRG